MIIKELATSGYYEVRHHDLHYKAEFSDKSTEEIHFSFIDVDVLTIRNSFVSIGNLKCNALIIQGKSKVFVDEINPGYELITTNMDNGSTLSITQNQSQTG